MQLPALSLVAFGESVLTGYPMQVLKFDVIFDGKRFSGIDIQNF
jgi:hypothetical protein